MANKDWVTVQPNLDPILEPVYDVIDAIDSVLAFMIAVLNIAQAILSVLKAFLVGLLDPIRAIVEFLIQTIRNIINDLRQLGVYMASDKNLFVAPYSDLVGGYEAYERRMLARLLDSTDPNRPNFSTSSAVLALFAYVSAEDAVFLIKLIFKIIAFFGDNSPKRTRVYPSPTTPRALFGPYGTLNFTNLSKSLTNDAVPDSVSINWQMPVDGNILTPEPKGFLIHVSTVPDGFGVLVRRPNSLNSAGVEDIGSDFLVGVDPSSGGPLRLYGGVSDLGTGGLSRDFSRFESEDEHAPKLYLTIDQNTPPIEPGLLVYSPPIGAATYFVKAGFFQKMGAGQSFSAFLKKEDLPVGFSVSTNSDGSPIIEVFNHTSTYYVRVRAVTKEYADAIGIPSAPPSSPVLVNSNNLHLYNVNYDKVVSQKGGSALFPEPPGGEINFEEFTDPSSPVVVAFPSTSMKSYIEAVQSAVIAAILTRVDLTEQPVQLTDDGMVPVFAKNTYVRGVPTGLEGSRYLLKRFGIDPEKFFNESDPAQFRRKLLSVAQQISSTLLESTPSQELMELVAENASTLTEFKWNLFDASLPDQTLLESINYSSPISGVGASPMGAGVPVRGVFRSEISRDGIFPSMKSGNSRYFVMTQGSADFSPVVYSASSGNFVSVYFVRKVLIEYEGGAVLSSAQAVLQIAGARLARPANDSQWITKRFLQDALAPVDEVLVDIEKFLIGILDGLQGLIDKIVAYIESIQARIYQLQALIERIRALLNSLRFFDLPSFNALLLVENGTSGIVSGLVSSGNKPEDSSLSYGGGAVFVFGGVPTFLLELLALAFSGGDE